ncbi:alpha-glucuronidase family glycosyl hydrolase [Cohnella nanjingensis]|uniref:Xylan alpha-1,2-glucuronidase n=1 Tax=Cohnella nanjingensis TaxID=1387779 RepID=A0A7X0RSF6_9BACL|nr:alpha-glucuronidase family glycosyl hydrolase [Cohnella nanjingensis]MBB6671389.1 alpha-glucuronidase [Cohnella nanjingensis]
MTDYATLSAEPGYAAWLGRERLTDSARLALKATWGQALHVAEDDPHIETAAAELADGLTKLMGERPARIRASDGAPCIVLGTFGGSAKAAAAFHAAERAAVGDEGYRVRVREDGGRITIAGATGRGVLYGVFRLLRMIGTGAALAGADLCENPANELRMINQWDNADGSVERGYAGRSIFYRDGEIVRDLSRIRDYARLLASVGVNAIAINNVNVHRPETLFMTERCLPRIARIADVFGAYGIRLFLSVNYAAPIEIGGLSAADPLDPEVRAWWRAKTEEIYRSMPDFGGYLVKADSEFRPGPFTYGRDHADGANMLAEALQPFGGLVIWRCFVYNCKQDWRDRKTDRARAAFDHFTPLDGRFRDNVVLQVKNGPMDFQVREPVSPLFGAMAHTNLAIEFQATQEYTGQQRHLCYLVPQWKEALDFDTRARGAGSTVKRVVDRSLFGTRHGGFAAVSNIGDDANWTGHLLAQANLYGFGRLAWDPELSAEGIAEEWTRLTFGADDLVVRTVRAMLLDSWSIYESYTAPLGVGWMVKPNHHYGPDVDGYEYSMWGTYHFADRDGIGVDRTAATGTGYARQYREPNASQYESLERTPDELLLFFHHVPYTYRLKSGKTVIQHIYDSRFEGAERAEALLDSWTRLERRVDDGRYAQVKARLEEQAVHAKEWRDVLNAYFWRKSGIPDTRGRVIY